jgi:hypothetical protein
MAYVPVCSIISTLSILFRFLLLFCKRTCTKSMPRCITLALGGASKQLWREKSLLFLPANQPVVVRSSSSRSDEPECNAEHNRHLQSRVMRSVILGAALAVAVPYPSLPLHRARRPALGGETSTPVDGMASAVGQAYHHHRKNGAKLHLNGRPLIHHGCRRLHC